MSLSARTKETIERLVDRHTFANEMTSLEKYHAGRTKKAPKVRETTLSYADRETKRLGIYDWSKNKEGFHFSSARAAALKEVRDVLIPKLISESDTSEFDEVSETLPNMSHRRCFVRGIVDAIGSPALIYDAGLIELVFKYPEPNEGSFDSNPIRGFFLAFKTADRKEAKRNTEVFEKILEMNLLEKCQLSSSDALLKCMQYMILDAEEFFGIYEHFVSVKTSTQPASRRFMYHRSKTGNVAQEAIEKLKQAYSNNKFVSDDEKRKMILLL
jgi:hypothetical protein